MKKLNLFVSTLTLFLIFSAFLMVNANENSLPYVFVVDTIDLTTNTITSRNGMPPIVLSETFNMTIDGESIDIRDINEWDVLSIKGYDIRVVTNVILGTIVEISKADDYTIFTLSYNGIRSEHKALGGTFFPFPISCECGQWREPLLGMSVLAFIDDYSNIVASDVRLRCQNGGPFRYGYVLAVDWREGGLIPQPSQIHIMLEDGNVHIAPFAHTLQLSEYYLSALEGQLIRFRTNIAGQINFIEIVAAETLTNPEILAHLELLNLSRLFSKQLRLTLMQLMTHLAKTSLF